MNSFVGKVYLSLVLSILVLCLGRALSGERAGSTSIRVVRDSSLGVSLVKNRVCITLSKSENGRIDVQILNEHGGPFTFPAAQLFVRSGVKRCLTGSRYHIDKIRVLYY